jgi:hypothetical protein
MLYVTANRKLSYCDSVPKYLDFAALIPLFHAQCYMWAQNTERKCQLVESTNAKL